MQETLDKPFVAPILEYTSKRVLPKEAAILQKVGKQFPFNRGSYKQIKEANTGPKVNKLLQDALAAQAERHIEQLSGKESTIAK